MLIVCLFLCSLVFSQDIIGSYSIPFMRCRVLLLFIWPNSTSYVDLSSLIAPTHDSGLSPCNRSSILNIELAYNWTSRKTRGRQGRLVGVCVNDGHMWRLVSFGETCASSRAVLSVCGGGRRDTMLRVRIGHSSSRYPFVGDEQKVQEKITYYNTKAQIKLTAYSGYLVMNPIS